MALDKLVDSTQLDTDLTSVANAIRTKGGTSAQLAFPAGFVSAIGDIPSGGGVDISALAEGTAPTGAITIENVVVRENAFYKCTAITSVHINNSTGKDINGSAFRGCTALTTLVGDVINDLASSIVQGCSALTAVDIRAKRIYAFGFQQAANLATIVLRKSDVLTQLLGVQAFNSTPFASGGTGGTIYIPKVLYDHLGDNSSLDYKAASNWSTVDGYGTITWKKIEGSQYESYYADGSPVS